VSGPPSHLDLLAAARALRRAAVDGDPDIVHAELPRLRTQVMQHLHAEHDPVSSLTGALGQLVRDGQQRLLRVLGELLFGVEADDDTCTGIVRAAGRSSCCSAGRPSSKPLHSALDRAIGREPEDRVHDVCLERRRLGRRGPPPRRRPWHDLGLIDQDRLPERITSSTN
jgi:hypothetical protein